MILQRFATVTLLLFLGTSISSLVRAHATPAGQTPAYYGQGVGMRRRGNSPTSSARDFTMGSKARGRTYKTIASPTRTIETSTGIRTFRANCGMPIVTAFGAATIEAFNT